MEPAVAGLEPSKQHMLDQFKLRAEGIRDLSRHGGKKPLAVSCIAKTNGARSTPPRPRRG
jgi:hypothetical protein